MTAATAGDLEKDLQRDLNLPRRRVDQRRADGSKGGHVYLGCRLSENWMVQDIKELRAELRPSLLIERNIFHQREVECAHSGTDQRISASISECVGCRNCEGAGIPEACGA